MCDTAATHGQYLALSKVWWSWANVLSLIVCGSVLSREENAIGRLLKAGSDIDKTRAGKMMAAVAKAQNYSSQQL